MKWVVVENDWYWKKIPEQFRKEMGFEVGWGNGYAIIPPTHPLAGKDYYEVSKHVRVHEGLTFGKRIGSDLIEAFKLDPENIGSYIYGFDTCHYEDNIQKWPKEAVEAEAQNLAEQLTLYALNNERESERK